MIQVEEHSPFLETLIVLNQSKIVVEIGVAEAKTTAYLCAGAAQVGGTVYGYDIWDVCGLRDQFQPWSSKEKCEEYLRSKGHTNFDLTKINSKTPEFHAMIKQRHPVIDLAFIDGCHSYEGIKNDFDAVYSQLSETGIIVFHDTMSIDGCREFIIELRTTLWDGTFDVVTFPFGSMVYSNGGVVDRKTGVSMLVKRGFATIPQPCDEICNLDDHTQEIYVKEEEWYEAELKRAAKMKK